jgi:hypothetical protein
LDADNRADALAAFDPLGGVITDIAHMTKGLFPRHYISARIYGQPISDHPRPYNLSQA